MYLTVAAASVEQYFEVMVAKSCDSSDIVCTELPLANSGRYRHDRTICCVDSNLDSQKPAKMNHGDDGKKERQALIIVVDVGKYCLKDKNEVTHSRHN